MPGDYATLATPCPNCGGVVKENYRRYTCTGKTGTGTDACGFSFGKTPAGRTFELAEVEQLLRDKQIGPLEGFRSKAGWPFTSEIVLKYDEEDEELEARVRLRRRQDAEETGELVDFSGQEPLGHLPQVRRRGCSSRASNYVCEHAVPHGRAADADAATSRAGKIILQQPVEREQMRSCWPPARPTCWTSSSRCARAAPFKAFLAWDKEAGKVNFEFERRQQVPAAQGRSPRRAPARGCGSRRPRKTARQAAPAKAARREEGCQGAEGAAQDR